MERCPRGVRDSRRVPRSGGGSLDDEVRPLVAHVRLDALEGRVWQARLQEVVQRRVELARAALQHAARERVRRRLLRLLSRRSSAESRLDSGSAVRPRRLCLCWLHHLLEDDVQQRLRHLAHGPPAV